MTLKEAYEIQRKEVWSLRAENKRLKKQTEGIFPVEEKDSLERRVRCLERDLKTKTHDYEIAQKRWRDLDLFRLGLEYEILDLKEQVRRLQDDLLSMRQRAEKAEAEVQMLNGTNKKLEQRLNLSFENSSLPSSALPFRKKVPNSRKSTGRKPGAQPRHKGHSISRLTPTREPVYLPVPSSFMNNPDIYPTGKTITKQQIDIQVLVHVRDYIADEFRNRVTGARIHAPFPSGIINSVNYGPSVKALAFLLNNYYNVSMLKTKQCISDITGGVINLSAGTICNLSSVFSAATKKERAKIFSLLTHSDAVYSDATVSNINGRRKSVILCTNKEQVLYLHTDHKGHDGLKKTPLKDFSGTIIHDHDKSYYSYGTSHQECISHVLRYLVGATENEPHLRWHRRMHKLLQKMIRTAKRHKKGIPKPLVSRLTDEYESILETAAEEYKRNPPNKWYMDGFNLQKRLRDYQNAHLFFLSHPEIDYTNNISERGLRKFKRKQKQAVVLRSDSGGQRICDALTIIETARMQNQSIYDTVVSAFS